MVVPARHHVRVGGDGIGLLARLAVSSKCFPEPDPRLAACSVYEWPRLSVDRSRISSGHTRSSITHDSHDEAPSVDDGCRSATSSGGARVSAGVRTPEALHQGPSPPGQSAGTMARTQSYASGVGLAGGHGCGNRMAFSRHVSVGHALSVGA